MHQSATRRALVACALMASLAAFAAWAMPPPVPFPPPTAPARPSAVAVSEQYPLTGTLDRQSRPVSIVELGPDRYAFADYKNLFILGFVGPDRECRMIRPNITLPPDY